MAKVIQTTYVVRKIGADLSDLLGIHQKQFPGNQLAVWKTATHLIVKVAHAGEVSGKTLQECMAQIGYVKPKEPSENG